MDSAGNAKDILARIVEARVEAIARRKRVLPLVALKIAVEKKAPPARDFPGALERNGISVIAEMKKASPSHGLLRQDYHAAALAIGLERAGAAALSVLTEEDFFQGSLADLKEVSKVTRIPVLRKDFIVDPWQVWETRAAGGDAFLLITAILDDAGLKELLSVGRQLRMEALVEVHTLEEVERAVAAGARVIGVNNRDLTNFEVRLDTSLALAEAIPDDRIAVSESGIRTGQDIERLRTAGFDAFLVGEHLMGLPDPGAGLGELLSAVSESNSG